MEPVNGIFDLGTAIYVTPSLFFGHLFLEQINLSYCISDLTKTKQSKAHTNITKTKHSKVRTQMNKSFQVKYRRSSPSHKAM